MTLPDNDVVFNRLLLMDIMDLHGPVLHCVDKDTKFNAARCLRDETAAREWSEYQNGWSLRYVDHPKHIHADQGPQFRSRLFKNLCHIAGIDLTLSGVESHSALGEGECYHSFLRLTYRKVKEEFPDIEREHAVQLAVKAMNDTAGVNGISPTMIVFGAPSHSY